MSVASKKRRRLQRRPQVIVNNSVHTLTLAPGFTHGEYGRYGLVTDDGAPVILLQHEAAEVLPYAGQRKLVRKLPGAHPCPK